MSGQLITVGQGSLGVARSGVSIDVLQGFLTASGNAVTVNLSGVETEVLTGNAVVGGTSISGQEITSAAGTALSAMTMALSGLQITSNAGTIVGGQEANDTFIQSGTGTASINHSQALTGSEITSGQGTIQYSLASLAGLEATFSQGVTVQLTAIPLNGASISVDIGTLRQEGGVATLPNATAGDGGRGWRMPARMHGYMTRAEYEESIQKLNKAKANVIEKLEEVNNDISDTAAQVASGARLKTALRNLEKTKAVLEKKRDKIEEEEVLMLAMIYRMLNK